MNHQLPAQTRKRKLSASSLMKKIKDESEAEKRKKIRLEWYLKQLLLEKEMLVKENEIEFALAMQSIMNQQDAPAASIPAVPLAIPSLTTAPLSTPTSVSPPSLDCPNPFFSLRSTDLHPVKIEADEETDMHGLRVASPGPTSEDSHISDDMLTPVFAPLDECSKPEEIFSTEWEQIHCWWDEDELSQFLALPPSLVV